MYEFWHGHVKPMCYNKSNLCYMGTGSFIVNIDFKNVYKMIKLH